MVKNHHPCNIYDWIFHLKTQKNLAFLCIVSQKVEKNLVENRKSGWTCWINKSWTLDKSCLVSRLILSTISSHQPLHIVWKQTFKTHIIPYILSSVAVIVHYIFLLHITVPHIITILSSYQCSVLVKDHSFGPELKTGVGALFCCWENWKLLNQIFAQTIWKTINAEYWFRFSHIIIDGLLEMLFLRTWSTNSPKTWISLHIFSTSFSSCGHGNLSGKLKLAWRDEKHTVSWNSRERLKT